MPFTLRVSGFENEGDIPCRHTCDGNDFSPALEWEGEPEGASSFALVVEDHDAPGGTWIHWLMWDIPPDRHSLPEGLPANLAGTTGRNSFGSSGYGGPCPPRGRRHSYHFRIYALDRSMLGLPAGSNQADFIAASRGRVLAEAVYVGRYER